MFVTKEDELRRQINEILETIEIATKRAVLEPTMNRLKRRATDRILQIFKEK